MSEGGGGVGIADLVSGIALSRRARAVIFIALALLIGLSLAMIYMGVVDDEKLPGWIEAAVYLLGILFPALLIMAVLTLAEGGDTVVQNRTYTYMTGTLPAVLRSIKEEPAALVSPKALKKVPVVSKVVVDVHQYRGSCVARYRLRVDRSLIIRLIVEINIRKANVVLLFTEDRFNGMQPEDVMKQLRTLLRHTLAGAELEGFQVNSVVGHELMDGTPAIGLVLVRRLDQRFIVSPYERVYFAQDLMFFLKAAINECPALFVRATPPATPR